MSSLQQQSSQMLPPQHSLSSLASSPGTGSAAAALAEAHSAHSGQLDSIISPGSCRAHAGVQPLRSTAPAAAAGGTARGACPTGGLSKPPAAAQPVPVNCNCPLACNCTGTPVSAQGGMPPIIRNPHGKGQVLRGVVLRCHHAEQHLCLATRHDKYQWCSCGVDQLQEQTGRQLHDLCGAFQALLMSC